MNEYNEFISQQTVPPYGGQLTSEWTARVEDERPADPEPPQDTAPAPEEPVAEASPEEPEPSADESQTVQEAESQVVQDAESQTAQETEAEPRAAEEAASAAETDAESPIAEEAEPDVEPQEAPAPDADSEAAEAVRADLTAEHLIDPGDAERFDSGWREVKAAFVDDPADAVRQASALVGEAVDEVTTALTRLRQNLEEQAQAADQADTERLRQVLRGYGSLLTHIMTR